MRPTLSGHLVEPCRFDTAPGVDLPNAGRAGGATVGGDPVDLWKVLDRCDQHATRPCVGESGAPQSIRQSGGLGIRHPPLDRLSDRGEPVLLPRDEPCEALDDCEPRTQRAACGIVADISAARRRLIELGTDPLAPEVAEAAVQRLSVADHRDDGGPPIEPSR